MFRSRPFTKIKYDLSRSNPLSVQELKKDVTLVSDLRADNELQVKRRC